MTIRPGFDHPVQLLGRRGALALLGLDLPASARGRHCAEGYATNDHSAISGTDRAAAAGTAEAGCVDDRERHRQV